jgi:hypothetical protein
MLAAAERGPIPFGLSIKTEAKNDDPRLKMPAGVSKEAAKLKTVLEDGASSSVYG